MFLKEAGIYILYQNADFSFQETIFFIYLKWFFLQEDAFTGVTVVSYLNSYAGFTDLRKRITAAATQCAQPNFRLCALRHGYILAFTETYRTSHKVYINWGGGASMRPQPTLDIAGTMLTFVGVRRSCRKLMLAQETISWTIVRNVT